MRNRNNQPSAQQPPRVPRSRLDGLWIAGEPVAASRFLTGIVVSIDDVDIITCSITDGELVSGILVLGAMPAVGDTVEIEARGDLFVVNRATEVDGQSDSIQDAIDAANDAAADAAQAALDATTAVTAANGKNKVTYSLSSPGSAANTVGDIWFRKESATQTIIEQWEGLGGTSWSRKTLNDQVIANLDAGKLTAGSAFTNALWVKTNLTLGDATTNGVIQSHNFAGSPVGIFLDKSGMVAKGGTLTGTTIQGGTVTGATVQTDTAASGNVRAVMNVAVPPGGSTATGNFSIYNGSTYIGGVIGETNFGVAALVGPSGYNGPIITTIGTAAFMRSAGTPTISSVTAANNGVVSVSGTLSVSDILNMNGHSINSVLNLTGSGLLTMSGGYALSGGGTIQGGPTISGGPTLAGAVTVSSLTGTGSRTVVASATGVISAPASSMRYKENDRSLLDEIDPRSLLGLDAITWQYKDREFHGDRRYMGFAAESVDEAGLDLLVDYDADGRPDNVRYADMVAPLLELIKEQDQRLKALEGEGS